MILKGLRNFFSLGLNQLQPNETMQLHTGSAFDFYQKQAVEPSYEHIDVSIPYYPHLVKTLEQEHNELLSLYADIGNAISLKEFDTVFELLAEFKERFKSHLDTKNIKCYGYLEQCLRNQKAEFYALRQFRKEMRTIERSIIKFLDYWMDYGVTRQSVRRFNDEYETIAHRLVKRIEREESHLHTLYDQT